MSDTEIIVDEDPAVAAEVNKAVTDEIRDTAAGNIAYGGGVKRATCTHLSRPIFV